MGTAKSAKWFSDYIKKNISNTTLSQLKREGTAITKFKPGMLVTYLYDAKHKDTLPVWDAFPLVLVTSVDARSWKGINLHYIPPAHRIKIIVALLKAGESTKTELGSLRAIQTVLGEVATAYAPFTKMYLFDHIASPAINIHRSFFEMVISLPFAQFKYNK
jgi:hypothetical protein